MKPILVVAALLVLGCTDPWGPGISINVTQPPAGGATADQSYIVMWTLDARSYYDGGINLFVDTDLDPSTGLIPIAESLSVESTGYLWDCSKFPEDDYYVRALLFEGGNSTSDYSEGTVTITH